MIGKLGIENYQSHIKTEFDFVPGVNVITGSSDAGKSSTIRALKTIARNKPSGSSYRRHGTKKTVITLGGVTKLRTATKHQYSVGENVYKALRVSVPNEVEDTLRLRDENFQEQHDPYFLISDSPGQVAKTLNRVADLTIIDHSLAEIKKRVRDAKTRRKILEEELKLQAEKTSALHWAVGADEVFRLVEAAQELASKICTSALEKQIATVAKMQSLADNIPSVSTARFKLVEAMESLKIDFSVEAVIQKVEENKVDIPSTKDDLAKLLAAEIPDARTILNLKRLMLKVTSAQEELSDVPSTEDDLVALKSINIPQVEKILTVEGIVLRVEIAEQDERRFPEKIDLHTGIVEKLQDSSSAITPVERAICEVLSAEDCRNHAAGDYVEGRQEYDAKLKEVGACPLCGGSL